ncbi:MAG: glycine--tRNA ligase subunit beta [Polymorphobacter sp.]|uniref:glycine--tRNA ligase subunit beta n=1 Tax=Polymorphobacter sp. TaxID=1909290 RepID=UPI003A8C263E
MTRFLLEIGSEEIPARMQAAAAAQLARRFTEACAASGLAHGKVTADATPRRLWLIAEDMAAASAATTEELKGPRADAPPQAIEGFLKKTGLTRDQLEARDTGKGEVLFAVIHREGRSAADILSDIIPAIITAFDWPKSMRWGSGSARWVRPLTQIVALLGSDVVPASVHGLTTGRTTRGHRIHAPGPLDIESADRYAAQLRAANVIVDSAERRRLITERAAALAAEVGLSVIPDAGLEAENAGLTEWPVPLLGRFDRAFLAVPREVIQLTMRTNQKYFALTDQQGALAPAFIAVANLEASDGGEAIRAGNERVLSARLSDAKFFWDQDLATVRSGGLEAFLPKLETIVFHEKLGTVADKVARIAKLARWLAESGAVPGADPDMAEQAARLAKADLVSATVGEFPEVQGIAGGYLATAAGLDQAIADAVRDHYKPVGQGDDVPTAPLSVAVAIADKLDTMVSMFGAGLLPTGSKDPFALRRAALGTIRTAVVCGLPLELYLAISAADEEAYRAEFASDRFKMPGLLRDFFVDRMEQALRDVGVVAGVVRAVTGDWQLELRIASVMRLAQSLDSFITTEDGQNLLAGYKRATNILKAEDAKDGPHAASQLDAEALDAAAEKALHAALAAALPAAAAAVEAEDFTAAMAALAALRAPIDQFFADVMVNAPEPEVRKNRLALLAAFRDAVHSVADFSRIEG